MNTENNELALKKLKNFQGKNMNKEVFMFMQLMKQLASIFMEHITLSKHFQNMIRRKFNKIHE